MNKNTTFITTDPTGLFFVMPEHLKTWQGGYVYLKPLIPSEYGPLITLRDPFQTINTIKVTKDLTYPLPDKEDAAKSVPVRPFVAGPNVIALGEVTIKGHTGKTFRDKNLGHLDSIAKVDLNPDFICHTPHHILNCFECKDDPRDLKPEEGKSYMVLLGKDGEILGADYPGPVFYGQRIITYHNPNLNFSEEELLRMNNLSRIKAYYFRREFYQPNYDKETESDSLPDFRNTLLWKPSVVTNEKGEATLEFYCSDINTKFVGKIEGVGGEGLLGTKDFEFTVIRRKPISQGK